MKINNVTDQIIASAIKVYRYFHGYGDQSPPRFPRLHVN